MNTIIGATKIECASQRTSQIEEIRGHGVFVEPVDARASVIFVHGCGSALQSPHDCVLADYLVHHHYATLLLDILSPNEEATDIQQGNYRFNAELLAHRLLVASDKLANAFEPELPIVYVGVGTGAAAALIAASRRPGYVAAVICRTGRPDLAGRELENVHAPTLLLVGSDDPDGITSNQNAFSRMQCDRDLLVIPGGGQALDEPASMQLMQKAITRWLDLHVVSRKGV